MNEKSPTIRLLLVDDEHEFREAARTALERRGFHVTEADNGRVALQSIRVESPGVVVLDLKMPGLDGISTLKEIRKIAPGLPVIILTGHGQYDDAIAGLQLGIVDFVQKPLEMAELGRKIRHLLKMGDGEPLRERTIAELMVLPERYPMLTISPPLAEAAAVLSRGFLGETAEHGKEPSLRSARVYGAADKFLGMVRFCDLLKLVLPRYLADSPYPSCYTGMFLAQCKVIGKQTLRDIMGPPITVEIREPLMTAVYLMVKHHLVNLPVTDRGELVGFIREKDIVLEVAEKMGSLPA